MRGLFLQSPLEVTAGVQNAALAVNTVLLMAFLVVNEVGFSGKTANKRKYLSMLYPLLTVLVGLLVLAVYKQGVA